MSDRYEPRPHDHLVEPMFHALGTGDAPAGPAPALRALRGAAVFALVGSVLLGTTFAYTRWGTEEPRVLDARGLGLPALLMACGSAVYLVRAWRARGSGAVGTRGRVFAAFSVLYVVLCWFALDG